jgi:hypothetical protein
MTDIDENNSFVKAGTEAYKQQLAKDGLLEKIVDEVIESGKPNLAASIGVFVVYVQLLEQHIKRIISITYSFKSYFNNKGYSVLYSTDAIFRDTDSLGTLTKILKKIKVRDEKTHEQVLDSFIKNLEVFVQKRNNYIHKLLSDPKISDLSELLRSLSEANVELMQLITEAEAKLSIIMTTFELDGYPYTFARHFISSEKYGPKPSISSDK